MVNTPQPSPAWKRWAPTLLKWALAALILGFVGQQFYRDLNHPDLGRLEFRPLWVVASAGLYIVALGFSAWYWRHLLLRLGQQPGWLLPAKAYFLGHFGKYLPGKAWALLLRGTLLRPAGVPVGLSIITAFYEVLTTMATGALAAAILFVIFPPEIAGLTWHPVYTGLLLVGLLAAPLVPAVFNFLMAGLSRRFPGVVPADLPLLRISTLLAGVWRTGIGWGLLGMSVWCMLQAVLPEPPEWTPETWLRITAANALAYVAGFLAVFMPSGVGVREYFLLALLGFAGPEPLVAAAVLILRLTWTVAELAVAAVLLPVGSSTASATANPPTAASP